jgi:hypothetical protein
LSLSMSLVRVLPREPSWGWSYRVHRPSSSSSTNNDGRSTCRNSNWLVGAGKAGMIAVWDTHHNATSTTTAYDCNDDDDTIVHHTENGDDLFVDPVLSWKAHSGRWIADAKFVPGSITPSSTTTDAPSRLITAGNDGTVCLWDLSTASLSTGAPKLLHRTGKAYHSSGIFCMDVSSSTYNDTDRNSNSSNCKLYLIVPSLSLQRNHYLPVLRLKILREKYKKLNK